MGNTTSKWFSVSNVSNNEICIPPNNYLPDLAGRWMGILDSHVEDTVPLVVALNFRKYRQESAINCKSWKQFTDTQKQIQKGWEEHHEREQTLQAKASRLEGIIRAHNFDLDVDNDYVDSEPR